MGVLGSLQQIVTGRTNKVKEEMSAFEKYGLKMTFDLHNAMKTEMELDVLSFIEDPRNDADSKIHKIDRLIVLNLKYLDPITTPRVALLISNWEQAMQIWAAIIDEKKELFGDYYQVEFEELYPLPDGQFLIRKVVQDLSPQVFSNLFFQYKAGSEWQKRQLERQGKGGAELKFTPVKQYQKVVQRDTTEYDEEEEKDVFNRLEYIGNTEFIPLGWIVYSWLHPTKFSFPNTPIVIQTAPQQGQQNPTIVPTSNLKRPQQSSAAGMTS